MTTKKELDQEEVLEQLGGMTNYELIQREGIAETFPEAARRLLAKRAKKRDEFGLTRKDKKQAAVFAAEEDRRDREEADEADEEDWGS